MKYIVMAALLMAGVAAYAQQPIKNAAAQERMKKLTPEERAKNLTKRYGLSEEQEAKVKALYEEQDKATEEMRAKRKAEAVKEDREVLIQELKARREEFKTKMKDILTPEQYTKWQAEHESSRYESLKKQRTGEKALEKGTLPAGN